MKNKAFTLILTMEVLLCMLLAFQSLRFWLEPARWGWPQEIRQRGLILTVFAFVMIVASLTVKSSGITPRAKRNSTLCIIVLTLGIGLFIMLYLPKPPSVDVLLEREKYSPQDVPLQTDCEKVNKFVAIGSQRLDIGNRTVLVPAWLQSSLEMIPKENLVECFADALVEQETLINQGNGYDEEPIRKLHALVFEAKRLGILGDLALATRLGDIACNKNIDIFGKLVLESYLISHGNLPTYDYSSGEGREILFNEMCT